MKTIKNLFLCALALIFIVTALYLIISYQYNGFSKKEQDAILKSYIKSECADFIYSDGSKSVDEAAEMINTFVLSLPNNINQEFLSEWKVIMGKSIASDTASNVAGATSWNTRIIRLNLYDDPEIIHKTFIHEFGHYFDLAHGYISKSAEFQELYIKHNDSFIEKDTFVPAEYSTSTAQEFFASVFKEYYVSPEHLQSIIPEAYEYIDQVTNEATTSNSWLYKAKNNVLGFFRQLNNQDVLIT